MGFEDLSHKEAKPEPQKGPRIRKNQSVLIKFRMPWAVFRAYEEEAKKDEFASVSLLCKAICCEKWPAIREYRLREAEKHLKHASELGFSASEMVEAKKRLMASI